MLEKQINIQLSGIWIVMQIKQEIMQLIRGILNWFICKEETYHLNKLNTFELIIFLISLENILEKV